MTISLMKTSKRKIPARVAAGLLLLSIGLTIALSIQYHPSPDLSEAICQPGDLGELYHPTNRSPTVTNPYLGETVVDSYTVELADIQRTYTVLDCTIVRYTDSNAAQRAFEKACAHQVEPSAYQVGNEACDFAGPAPHNLAFRREVFLVLMSGDISHFPAAAVDERLR